MPDLLDQLIGQYGGGDTSSAPAGGDILDQLIDQHRQQAPSAPLTPPQNQPLPSFSPPPVQTSPAQLPQSPIDQWHAQQLAALRDQYPAPPVEPQYRMMSQAEWDDASQRFMSPAPGGLAPQDIAQRLVDQGDMRPQVKKLPDGNLAVRREIFDAIRANAPQPQQTLGQDLANVPANISAGGAQSLSGMAGMAGTLLNIPGRFLERITGGQIGQTLQAPGKALQAGGGYLAGGAQALQRENPVQGQVGKALVGVGQLGIDATMGAIAGPEAFTASFAGRSAGQMYSNARQMGASEGDALGKGLVAGFTAALTPELAKVFPPQAGQSIAEQVARSYLGTGSMVAAQGTLDEITLKTGTGQKIDLSQIFPEAAAQGVIGVLMHAPGMMRGAKGESNAQRNLPANETAANGLDLQHPPQAQGVDENAGRPSAPDVEQGRPAGVAGMPESGAVRNRPDQAPWGQGLGGQTGAEAAGGNAPETNQPTVTQAKRNDSTIYLGFDGMKSVPTVEEIKQQLADAGFPPQTTSVVKFIPDAVTGAAGNVKFRIDASSSADAAAIYRMMFGHDEQINNPSIFQDSAPFEDRLKASVEAAKSHLPGGTALEEPAPQPINTPPQPDQRPQNAAGAPQPDQRPQNAAGAPQADQRPQNAAGDQGGEQTLLPSGASVTSHEQNLPNLADTAKGVETNAAAPAENAAGAVAGTEAAGTPTLTESSPEILDYHDGNIKPLIAWLDAHDPVWQDLRAEQDRVGGNKAAERHAIEDHLNGIFDTITERGEPYAPQARQQPEDNIGQHPGTAGERVPAASGGGDSAPQRETPTEAPKLKSKAAIERAILDHYNQHEGDALMHQQIQDESAGENTGGNAQTFLNEYPKELRNLFTKEEFDQLIRRRLITLTNDPTKSGGEDAMSDSTSIGVERYADMLRRSLGRSKAGRLRAALALAEKSPNPEMNALAERWRELDAITQQKAQTPKLKTYGFDRVKMAENLSLKELEAIRQNLITDPKNKNTQKNSIYLYTKETHKKLDNLAWAVTNKLKMLEEERAAAKEPPKFFDPAAEDIQTSESKGIFGQDVIAPQSSGKQGGLFHEPVKVEPTAKAETPTERKIREQYKDTGATGNMFGGEGKVHGFGGQPEQPSAQAPEPRQPITQKAVGKALFGEKSFIGGDVIPTAKEGAKIVREAAGQLQSMLAPQTRGEQARQMQGIAREHGAELAQRGDRALEALKSARKYFDRQKPADNFDFIDRMEGGDKQSDPQLQMAADKIRAMLDGRRQEVQALGKGKLEHFIQDYFPHIWKDPEQASKVIGQAVSKRPLEGSKSFLKKRSIDTFSEGIKLGLEPISNNPVDLVLLKIREMDRYILGQKMLEEMKGQGLAKFVGAMAPKPDGYTKIDDKIAQVYGPPTVAVKEYVDRVQYEALNQVMQNLGIAHRRTTQSLGGAGKILGKSFSGLNKVETKFGSDLGVLAHEIGHQLDEKYNLSSQLSGLIGPADSGTINPKGEAGRFRVSAPKNEMDALTALRGDIPASTKKYQYSRDEQLAQVVEAYVHAPDRMKEVAPTLYQRFNDFVNEHEELAPLRDARASLSYQPVEGQVAHGGLLKMGEYYAPDAAANVINNYLSPGLRSKSGLFRAYLGAANVMNQAQLGFCAFHVGFTSMDAMTSKLALGIEQAMEGKPVQAFKSLVSTPFAPFTNIIQGSKLLREWIKPGSEGADIARLVNAAKLGGGRAKQDSFYRTDMTAKMVKAFREGNIIGGLIRVPGGMADLFAKPVMEYIVPRQKLGIFADLARKELEKLGPDATRDEVRAAMGKAWDSVDNRMGQVVYDNLFWKKAVKDIGMASVRSLGWNLGTFRELGGGVLDFGKAGLSAIKGQNPEFTHRMAYTLAMPALAGLIGGVMHYLMTGKKPDELKDYFFPKTGEQDANGHDVRLSLPTYMKDVYAYGHAPVQTLGHKLHPAIAATLEMLNNKDFYGTKIRNEDDPLMKQAFDLLKHAGKQFIPFGVQGYQKLSEEGASPIKKALPFIGITQAPSSVGLSKAEQLAQDLMRDKMPVGSRTTEEAARSKEKADLSKALRQKQPAAMKDIEKRVQAGTLNADDAKAIIQRSQTTAFESQVKHLDAADAIKVWQVATPAERQKIRIEMMNKVAKNRRFSNEYKRAVLSAITAGKDAPRAIEGSLTPEPALP